MKKKICVITGTRAEYGLLKYLLLEIKKSKKFDLQLLVTGSHLSKTFGNTYKEIIQDGFGINEKINILQKNDNPSSISKSAAIALSKFAKSYKKLKPDFILLLGDRYELIAAAISSLIFNIPIIHLHGGETTLGAFDEAIRHSITKMSHIHFVTHNKYKNRVIQLGENKNNIYNVGGYGVDSIKNTKILSKSKLEEQLNIKFKKKNILVTFHPVTLENRNIKKNIDEILKALSYFNKTLIIFTFPNADTYGKIIINRIIQFVKKNKNSCYFESLGQKKYYSCLKYVDAVLGNSSSGILEAPSFKIATVNIGDRQYGRIQADSIINCNPVSSDIIKSIQKTYSKKFQIKLNKTVSPYGLGGAAKKTIKILEKIKSVDIKKKFFDL